MHREEEPYKGQVPKVFPRNKGRVRQVKESITSNPNGKINGEENYDDYGIHQDNPSSITYLQF